MREVFVINVMYWVRHESEKMTETYSMYPLFTVDRYGASLRHKQPSFVILWKLVIITRFMNIGTGGYVFNTTSLKWP